MKPTPHIVGTNVHEQNDDDDDGDDDDDDGDNDGGSSVWWLGVTKAEKQVVIMSSWIKRGAFKYSILEVITHGKVVLVFHESFLFKHYNMLFLLSWNEQIIMNKGTS